MKYYPLKFQPIYKRRVWGGKNLESVLRRELPWPSIGESWELSANTEGTSVVSNGFLAGKNLTEVIQQYGKEILGENFQHCQQRFPLLIKFIDANDKLSVQVHPDDQYAFANEGEAGKTELWYILEAKPGAKLIYGLKPGTSAEVFQQALENNRVNDVLNEIEVKGGEVIFIPAGTIHAIGEGILLAEIQQNSNVTYRVHDWNRLGLDGKPRQLHIKQALDVINYSKPYPKLKGITRKENGFQSTFFAHCPHFTVEILEIEKRYTSVERMDRFEVLLCVQGSFSIIYDGVGEDFGLGETVLMPASLGDYKIEGKGKIIKTYIAESKGVLD